MRQVAMQVIGGCIFVLVTVLTGFMMAGGHIHALIHPSEFVTIGGAAIGAAIVMAPKKVVMDAVKATIALAKGSPFNKAMHLELYKLSYQLAKLVRKEGLLALDSHVSNPHGSPLFKQYPKINANHHAKDFLCEALSQIVDGKADSAELHAGMAQEIEVMEKEHHMAIGVVSKTADGLPGFGIVAAVLGIVVTMQAIGGPVEEIGHKVGAALVGTFLGILMSYGFMAPMAARMESMGHEEADFFRSMSAAVVALNDGNTPKDVVTKAKRMVGTAVRPNAAELKAIFSE
jgi:chemotaxis protein MotA